MPLAVWYDAFHVPNHGNIGLSAADSKLPRSFVARSLAENILDALNGPNSYSV